MSKLDLKEKIRGIPASPGVYFMKDDQGRTLYIGKAKNLRNRVTSYFGKTLPEPRIGKLMSQVKDVEWLVLPSEVDALLAEARLIKDTQPRFNSRLKDDKSFPVLAVTRMDDFPKVWVKRETDSLDMETWGPFTNVGDLRDAVKTLQKIFRFATCQIPMWERDEKRKYFRPCLLYSLQRCTAPCADLIGKEAYEADIASLRRFLQGEREALFRDLDRRMQSAAKNLEFERAADLRDQIQSLRKLEEKSSQKDYLEGDITPLDPAEGLEDLISRLELPFRPRRIEGVDIAHVSGDQAVGSLVSFQEGIPWKEGYRKYRIREVKGIDDYAMIREVIRRRFRTSRSSPPPDILLVDGGLGQFHAAREAGEKSRLLLSLAKREEILFRDGKPVRLPLSSAAMRLLIYVRDEAHRFAQHYHHQLRRKAMVEE